MIKEVSDRSLQTSADRTIDLQGRTLMPGLIDLHVHAVAVELNLAQQVHMPNVLVMLRSTLLLRGMLRRGFTMVRDAGGAGYALKQAIETGLTDGPRLFVSGRALSQTGGHGDMRARTDYLADSSPCAAACVSARWLVSPTACARRLARNCCWAPTRSRSWRPAAWHRRPIPWEPGAIPRTRSAPSSRRRGRGRPMCSPMPTPPRPSVGRCAAVCAPSSTAIWSIFRRRA